MTKTNTKLINGCNGDLQSKFSKLANNLQSDCRIELASELHSGLQIELNLELFDELIKHTLND